MPRVQVSTRTRFEIFKRDNFTCIYCGGKPPKVVLNIDHLIAVANGGTNDITNLVTSCRGCNAGKSDVPLATLPGSIADKLADRQEKLAQLQAMSRETIRLSEQLEDEVELASDHWMRLEGSNPDKYQVAGECEAALRRFIPMLGLETVMEMISVSHKNLKGCGKYKIFKYFCGCCWKTVRDREDESNELADGHTSENNGACPDVSTQDCPKDSLPVTPA